MQDVLYNAFMYSAALTPRVTAISPTMGPIGGGTIVTFTGESLLPEGEYTDSYDGWFSTEPGLQYSSNLSFNGAANHSVVRLSSIDGS